MTTNGMLASNNVSVFVDTYRWSIRPSTTDWRYIRYSIPRLADFEPELRIHPQLSLRATVAHNLSFIRSKLKHKLGINSSDKKTLLGSIDRHELERAKCDVVFSHGGFPANADPFPIVWQHSILDPEMQRAHGATESDLRIEEERKRPLFERAAVVQVSTHSEARRLDRTFPESAGKFFPVPFFVPDLEASSEESILRKHTAPATINLLFVGYEAKRKGLDRLIAAYSLLPPSMRQRIRLRIVTKFAGGPVNVPHDNSVQLSGPLPYPEVLRLMTSAHIFAMPSRFESYGIVFLEAMSKGAIPIVPDWEVQREIVGNGAAGCVTKGEPAELANILTRLVDDEPYRVSLAIATRNRFVTHFSPQLVANSYRAMFEAARNRSYAGAV